MLFSFESNNQDLFFCSPASSSSQQGSSSGDLLPEMMESETPPASPPHGAGDPKVSSRRSPDPLRPESNTSAIPCLACSAHVERSGKGPGESGGQPNILTGLLEEAAISKDRRTLMGMVLKKISSATSGLNEAFGSLLKGFEVSNKIRNFWLHHTR